MIVNERKIETRGRKPKPMTHTPFDANSIKLFRGSELQFSELLFRPMKTNTELDVILSTEGGLMPGTSIMIAGGPGSGKTTLVLDALAKFTKQGYKTLFISGEMDEIGHYKYCKRMPEFGCVQTLFLKDYMLNVKEVIEYIFDQGYDAIGVDSIAEVIEMYRDQTGSTNKQAELWFLHLQDKVKKGENQGNYYTTFINIQQFTKQGDASGTNRIKHMVEAYAYVERSKDGLERSIHFEKNRDCDKDFKVYFSIYGGGVYYSYEIEKD